MSRKVELVREEKLFRLLPGRKESSRLEASRIALVDDTTALVVFDNLNQVARINGRWRSCWSPPHSCDWVSASGHT